GQVATPQPTTLLTNTAIPMQVPSSVSSPTAKPLAPDDATHQAQEQAWAQYLSERKTALALTPTEPIPTEGPINPGPTPILSLGWVECGTTPNSHVPYYISCWHGIISGEIVSISAGREGNFGDTSQGILRVITYQPNQQASSVNIYNTPQRV